MIKEELKKLGWREKELMERRKGDPKKIKMALRSAPGNDNDFGMDCATATDGNQDHISRICFIGTPERNSPA